MAVPTDACIAEFVTHGVSAECYEFGAAGLAAAIGASSTIPPRAKRMAADGRQRDDRSLGRRRRTRTYGLVDADARAATVTRARPALLVSLHDVSPLTVDACADAVAMLGEVGVRAADLTVFVIPHHEGAHDDRRARADGRLSARARRRRRARW